MITLALLEGIGLMMLVPMLEFIGITSQGGATGSISAYISLFFVSLNLPKTLPMVLFLYVLLISLRHFLVRAQSLLNMEINQDFIQVLRKRMFKSISYANWLFFTRTRSSDFVQTLISDIQRTGQGISLFTRLLSTIIMLCVYLILAFKLSFEMTILVGFFAIVVLLLFRKKTIVSQTTGKDLTRVQDKLYSTVTEHLGNMKLTKIFGAEQQSITLFNKATEDTRQNTIEFLRNITGIQMWFGIVNVVILSSFFYIAVEIISVPVDALLLLVFIFTRMMPRVSSLQQTYQHLIHMIPAFDSFIERESQCRAQVEDLREEDAAPRIVIHKQIRFHKVSFRYNPEQNPCAVNSVSFVIPAHQTTAIVGPSGGGKTTIADLLMGLILPNKGEILVDGKLLISERLMAWRKTIGYVPQDNFLFHDTIRANLQWAKPDASEEEMIQALNLVALKSLVEPLPQGLEIKIGDRGVRLSGGEKQRLALARVLLIKPQLIVLDEATSSLDVENEQLIQKAIANLHGNITMLIIAHRLTTIRNVDSIVVLEKGSVVETGSWEELSDNKNSRFQEIVRMS